MCWDKYYLQGSALNEQINEQFNQLELGGEISMIIQLDFSIFLFQWN